MAAAAGEFVERFQMDSVAAAVSAAVRLAASPEEPVAAAAVAELAPLSAE